MKLQPKVQKASIGAMSHTWQEEQETDESRLRLEADAVRKEVPLGDWEEFETFSVSKMEIQYQDMGLFTEPNRTVTQNCVWLNWHVKR